MASGSAEVVAALSGGGTPSPLPQPVDERGAARLGGALAHPLTRDRNREKGEHDHHLWALGAGFLPLGSQKRLSPEGASGVCCDRVAARNRSILWVFLETGMRASELCRLRLSDVDHGQRTLCV